jgi:hypothetical protein
MLIAAQGCLPEGITFTTQNQINSFQVDYPGCTEIIGPVRIQGNDIINLGGLNVLTSLGHDLSIGYEWWAIRALSTWKGWKT